MGTWNGKQNTFTVLTLAVLSLSLTPLSRPSGYPSENHSDPLVPMLSSLEEQEVASTPKTLESHMHSRGKEKNPTKIQETSTSVKLLGFQWPGIYKETPSKIADNVVHLAPPTIRMEKQHLVDLLGF